MPIPEWSGPAFIQDKFPEFAGRLDGEGPIGVAVSGGGDSVALLYALAAWNQRPLEVFCVDHGLNPQSVQWTQSVADHAARVGAGFTALRWQEEKPITGLAAAARLARHRLLAEAARGKRVSVLCLAHTPDDIAEAEAMREQGSNVGAPKVWSPSPVWPEGRGIFLYRPFLDVRRETLRHYLNRLKVSWIEDPANENPHSLRARTRKALRDQPVEPNASGVETVLTVSQMREILYAPERLEQLGMIAFEAEKIQALSRQTALKLLATAIVCAGGSEKLPKQEKVVAMYERLSSEKAMTLCGARIQQTNAIIRISREVGDIRRSGRCSLSVRSGEPVIWDGRFVITAKQAGSVWPSGLLRGDLRLPDRDWLLTLPENVRGNQPAFIADDQKDNQNKCLLTNPALTQSGYKAVEARCLVGQRLWAALGLVTKESDQDTQKAIASLR